MASLRISFALKLLLFFALLLIASRVSATENTPSLHEARARKLGMEYRTVGKATLEGKRASLDIPWRGGYNPPNNNP